MREKRSSLQLVGDGDDIEVLRAVERAFAVTITDAEAAACHTVGQLYDVVAGKLGAARARGPGCPTAMAFFRLRTALRRAGCERPITPRSDLRELVRPSQVKAVLAAAGLAPPPLAPHPGAYVVALSMLPVSLGLAIAGGSAVWILLGIGSAVAMMALLPGTFPASMATAGEFARAAAAWNHATLRQHGAGLRPAELWKAFVIVVRESCGTDDTGVIDRDTTFL